MQVSLLFQEKPVRSISLRQLSRRTSSLIDEIVDSGAAVLISRYGQPVALLAPLEGACADRDAVRTTVRAEKDQPLPVLDPMQRRVLESVAAEFPYYWNPNDPWIRREDRLRVLSAMTKLEFAGCIEKGDLGVRATALGKRVCASTRAQTSAS